jgi:NitT/TauT family transport system permease protein
MKDLLHAFAPNRVLSGSAVRLLLAAQLGALALLWVLSPFVFLPTPRETWAAFRGLWSQGLGAELVTSFYLNLQAILAASAVSLLLAYASVMPFFRPVLAGLSRLRFLSLAGLTFLFTLLAGSGHQLKLYLLVFSITVFFVTGMADVLNGIPRERFDLARTLGMSEWEVVWEVVVLAQVDKVLDVVRQNAAIGWMMLTMVEGMSRSEGGVGALLLNQNKHFHLAAVLAIQVTILLLGLGQDYAIGAVRRLLCPWADLAVERRS